MSPTPLPSPAVQGDGATAPSRISALEWLVAALGLVLVVGGVAILLVDASREGGADAAPQIGVRIDSVGVTPGGAYFVRYSAVNTGRRTAADVGIAAELRDAEGTETTHATVDFVPGRSERHGGLFFRRDPRRGAVRVWAEGYQDP